MIRDPFYNQILTALSSSLDEDCFELCAGSILRKELPTLVTIRGGSDSGMDGVTYANGPFLVCTTDSNVIRNLTGSLKSYLRAGGNRRSVVLATSQELSQKRRQNLEARAQELGFSLRQIYSRAAMAERLYYEPRWCKELLGLTGRPSALSLIPRTERPLNDQSLVGRDDDVRWLEESSGDLLLLGQPGCGKTFLLRSLALQGWGLFLITEDVGTVAEAIRAQKPNVIIVDDAHFRVSVLSALRQLRAEISAEFDIVATSWNGAKDSVAQALLLPDSRIRELSLLTRDQIVEVIRHAGLGGPVELIREIVNQAEGRPGLAVTLSWLSLNGDVEGVFYGDALGRSLGTTFRRLVGDRVTQVLASFALGGDQGSSMASVATALGVPIIDLHVVLVGLAAGGVIRQKGESRISVWPRTLRYVLVRDTFFSGRCDLPKDALIDAVYDRNDLSETLIGALNRGAKIPEINEIIESIDSPLVWSQYASLGEDEAKFVLHKRPSLIRIAGREILKIIPEHTIPLLLEAAVGDERNLGSATEHPLRWIQDWIKEAEPGKGGEALRRRSLLMSAVREWLRTDRNERVGRWALSLALKPSFETYTPDAGSGMRIHIVRGLLSDEELEQFRSLWHEAKILLVAFNLSDWKDLLNAIHDWIYPETAGVKKVPPKTREIMRSMAARMVTDIMAASPDHPSIQQWARDLSKKLGLNFEIIVDQEFETLFPKFNRKDLENLEERTQKQYEQVVTLAEKWRHYSPEEVASRLIHLEEAATVVRNSWPRWTPNLCGCLANHVSKPNEWLEHFIRVGLPYDLCEPFLRKVVTERMDGWEIAIATCFGDPRYEGIVIYLLLSLPDVPDDLLTQAVRAAERYCGMVQTMCLQGHVPEHNLRFLLNHENYRVSTDAAIGVWWAQPRGEICASLFNDWRAAILRTEEEGTFTAEISEILKNDACLAMDWVIARIQSETSLTQYSVSKELMVAISVLSTDQKLAILSHVEAERYSTSVLISELGTNDLQVFEAILNEPRFLKYHLAPLAGHPKELWAEKVSRAISAGYSSDQIASATLHYDNSWSGDESAMWQRWIDDFNAFTTHQDPDVCSVARVGITKARQRQTLAAEEEHREAIYGV